MDKEFQVAIVFAINSIFFYVAFGYGAMMLWLAQNPLSLFAATLCAFAGIFGGTVFAWVSIKCYKRSKKLPTFSVIRINCKGEKIMETIVMCRYSAEVCRELCPMFSNCWPNAINGEQKTQK